MSPAPRVWLAEPREAEQVAALLAAFRDHLGHDSPSDGAMRATVARLVEHADTDYLLAAPDEGSPPAGVCQLRYRLSVWTAAPDCWLEDLFVAEAARGRGCGAALVRAAIERATERGCRRIELDANERNATALALYRRLGFSERSKGGAGRDLFVGRPLSRPAGRP